MDGELAAAAPQGPERKPPRAAIQDVQIRAPSRGNRRLERLLERAGADSQLRAWWYMAQINAERLGMSDHSWVHVQIVVNSALRLLRLLNRAGIEATTVGDHGMQARDAEVVVAAAALLHDVGMSIHRADHESFSLFLAAPKLDRLLDGIYEEPERTVVASEALHAIIGHRRDGRPYTVEAGVLRVADALDMAQGRSRIPFEAGRVGIHSVSAAAIDQVRISPGETRPIRVEIRLNNSAGIFQLDDLLATKLRGTPLERQVEVIASLEGDAEKRLFTSFRLPDPDESDR